MFPPFHSFTTSSQPSPVLGLSHCYAPRVQAQDNAVWVPVIMIPLFPSPLPIPAGVVQHSHICLDEAMPRVSFGKQWLQLVFRVGKVGSPVVFPLTQVQCIHRWIPQLRAELARYRYLDAPLSLGSLLVGKCLVALPGERLANHQGELCIALAQLNEQIPGCLGEQPERSSHFSRSLRARAWSAGSALDPACAASWQPSGTDQSNRSAVGGSQGFAQSPWCSLDPGIASALLLPLAFRTPSCGCSVTIGVPCTRTNHSGACHAPLPLPLRQGVDVEIP